MERYHVHIHQSEDRSLPPGLWNVCFAPDRQNAITAVLRAHDAQETKPKTVHTLDFGTPGKTICKTTAHDLQWGGVDSQG